MTTQKYCLHYVEMQNNFILPNSQDNDDFRIPVVHRNI